MVTAVFVLALILVGFVALVLVAVLLGRGPGVDRRSRLLFKAGALIFFVLVSAWLFTGSNYTQTFSVSVRDGAVPVRNARLHLAAARYNHTNCGSGLDGYGKVEGPQDSGGGSYIWRIQTYQAHGRQGQDFWRRPDIALCIETSEGRRAPIWYSKRLPARDMNVEIDCDLSTVGPQKCVSRYE